MRQNYLQNYIIFDINSSSIGVLVFNISFNKKANKKIYHEVFSTRESITNANYIDFETFFNKTIKTFESIVKKAHKYSGNKIEKIYINVSAPWSSSQKRIVHFEKENEFVFNEEIANKIIKKELEEPLIHTHDFKKHPDLSIIERRTIDVLVSGYYTKYPYGKKTKDVDIHSLISVMSYKTKETFNHVIERAFHKEAHFFSNSFMTYKSIIELFPKENDITVIDISGELTEINIIIKDKLKKIGSIPVGAHHIIRHLADKLNMSYFKIKSLILMYQNNELDKKYKKSIEAIMRESFTLWFRNFYNFLDEVSKEYIIPDTFLLLAPEYIQAWFSEFVLKTEELNEHIHTGKNISLLDLKSLWRSSKKTDFIHIKDDNLALCLDFVERFLLEEQESNKID